MEAVTHCVDVKDNIYPANILLTANFLYQTLDSIDDAKSQAQRVHSTGAAKRSYPMSKIRGGCQEELPYVQGKKQLLRFAGAAVKRYPTSKVRETQVRQ